MKTKLPLYIRNIFVIILLFAAMATSGQSRQEKTLVIIDSMDMVEYLSFFYPTEMDSINIELYTDDSLKLKEIEKMMSPDSLAMAISPVFDEFFTEKEIDDLYAFVQSTAYKKIAKSGDLYDAAVRKYFIHLSDLGLVDNSPLAGTAAEKKVFEPIPVNRKNGFYEVLDYHMNGYPQNVTLEKKPAITFDYIEEVLKEYSMRSGLPEITIRLNKEGAQKFYELTKKNIGRPIAIVIDKYIVSMPNVSSEIPNGRIILSGQSTDEETDRLIKQLREE